MILGVERRIPPDAEGHDSVRLGLLAHYAHDHSLGPCKHAHNGERTRQGLSLIEAVEMFEIARFHVVML